jgi:26S proteasome regulatory subunit N7
MEDETLYKLPLMPLARHRFLIKLGARCPDIAVHSAALLKGIQEQDMVPYYEIVLPEAGWRRDEAWLSAARARNAEKVKSLEAAIVDAVQNLGESEVRQAHLNLAEFWTQVGDKDAAEKAFKLTLEKTVGLGQKLDIAFCLTRLGFFFGDESLVSNSLAQAHTLIESGGDWDRRNRLRIYDATRALLARDIPKANELFLATIASFNADEMYSPATNAFYTVICALLTLDRVELSTRIIDSPEVAAVANERPLGALAQRLAQTFYDGEYSQFMVTLADLCDILRLDQYLSQHIAWVARELRVRAYAQFLQSYRSVTLSSMADAFGVTNPVLDSELSHFIALGRLPCRIDAVQGIVETTRPDSKNAQYVSTLRQGDLLLNRIQKLSRVIHL